MSSKLWIVSLLLFSAITAPECHADRVTFKNGRTLDCTIKAVHPDSIEVSLASGTISIPRNQLARVERSKPSSTPAPTKEAWQQGNILSAQHAPKAYADLAAHFRALMKSRNAALDAKYLMGAYQREIHTHETQAKNLGKKINTLGEQLTAIRTQIQEIQLPDQAPRSYAAVRAYNELFVKKQKLRDTANSILIEIEPLERKRIEAWDKIPAIKAKHKQAMTPIPLYRTDLEIFEGTYATKKPDTSTLDKDPQTRALFDTIDRYLTQFKKNFSTDPIVTRHVHNSTIVRAVINGAFTGEFILDTGATSMTISESFASKLGLQLEALSSIKMVVADGSVVDVKSAKLASVSVGKSEVKDVKVLVVPDNPNLSGDGLLGMGFLKHFSIRVNGTTGELELTRFIP